jgi:CRP-like cAMP-binding protein
LKYERENRKLEEIERAIPWLKTFPDLMNFINLEETPESSHKLLIEMTWSLFYQYYKKNLIFKKASEKGEFFFILLKGKMLKLNMVFKRDHLTLEEYLIYLFKMKLIKEKEILRRCRILNNFYADIDGENLTKFCKENPQFNYDKLKERAKKEIIELGFKLEDFEGKKEKYIYSIDNYIKIAEVKKDTKDINNILATPKFYIGSYQKVGYITKGMAIGNLTNETFIDDSTYITEEGCDIVFLNKKNSNLKKLYEMIIEKKQRALSGLKNSFYIFRHITDSSYINKIIPFFQYKLYHKGDIIFAQDSFYEGIYLIKSGKVGLHFESPVMEISSLISDVKNSLKDFKKFISDLKVFNKQNLDDSELLKANVDQNTISETNHLYLSKRYDILTIDEFSIFGTNELYNYKTGLYYFTAECITKEALIYFLPKKYFHDLLRKENPVDLAVAKTVESKAELIIEKLKLIIRYYEKNRNHLKNNEDNIEEKENKMKTFTIFNSYSNYIKTLRRNNNNINYPDLKLYTKMDEKTYEFPVLLKDKYLANKHFLTETLNENDYNINENYKTIREKLMNKKTLEKNINKNNINITGNIFNTIRRRNKTYEQRINKTRYKFKKDSKLKLPFNFPFNVQNAFPTLVKNRMKNYNIKYINNDTK